MQTTPWTLELHSPVGQHNDAARWPDSFPTSHGKHNDLTLPSAHQSKKRRAFVIRTALSAVLVLVLAAYFCRSPGGHWLSKNAVTRRLASSDEDEACQDLLELIERASGGESGESSSPKELFQSSSPGSGTGSRKRRHSTGNQDEVEKFKKPLLEEDSQSTVANVQENLDIPRSSSAEASSAQQQTVSTREREFSVGLQRHDEPSTSSGTQGFEGTLHGAESMARPQAVMDPSDDDLLQQWFLDYILDPAFTESPADDTDRLKDTREHTGLSSNSASQQESPLRILLQRAMLPKSTSSQASTDGSTLSTSPVETPGPSHTPVSA
ncbi:uncharacterized protein EMH_0033590 [Eimeria mitis]|uniref:Transmembrane protein n=1 Tax=Eimeria mitis TaxID=44415 RepID=U6JQ60_9EIME|nr:uncharacterized protein EMH_0033590 [Eimeria mitis]CDJ27640.1 hypothetical protein EMH_0033590 [Eimeria mitis]